MSDRLEYHVRTARIALSCVLLLVLAGIGRAESGPLVNSDGFVLVDGKPRLVLGMYELPDDAHLGQLAKAGFNLVRASDVKALDRIQAHGMLGWLCISPALEAGNDAQRQQLTKTIQAGQSHPALLAWELPDEALWSVWYNRDPWVHGQQAKSLEEEIRKADLPAERKEKLLAQTQRAQRLTMRGLWQQAEEAFQAIYQQLGKSDPHPELHMSQAAADATALAEAMARGCAVVRELDPRHVLWQNHAPRNTLAALGQFNALVDVVGCDIYPAPTGGGHTDLKDVTLSSVGAYTERMRAAAPGKANWMVLQGFGWHDLPEARNRPLESSRRPNYKESRFMAYDALVHGANGLLYWGTSQIEKDSPLWNDLLKLGAEIRALEPALVGPRPAQSPVALAEENSGSIDPSEGPRLLLRQAGEDWVLIAVNEYRQPVPFRVTGLEALEGKTLYLLGSDEEHRIQGGQFRDGIGSEQVQVYATSRRFEPAKP